MAEVLKGIDVAKGIKEKLKEKIETQSEAPALAIVRLGNDPSDLSYERGILKNCESVGIKPIVYAKEIDTDIDSLLKLINQLNNDDNISGILVFRPLPKHIDEELIRMSISPDKDVDCMNPLNLGKIFEGKMDDFSPCTPKAAMELMKYYNIDLEGKNVVLINRSLVVGKPLAMMLLEENATVTICHSRTKDLKSITKAADIVITALGKPEYLDESYFSPDSIIIDVGVGQTAEGKLSGDVDYENVSSKVKKITPVPGGVGSITTSILLDQVYKAYENIKERKRSN